MPVSKVKRKILWIVSLIGIIGLAATLVLVGLTSPQSSTLEPTFPALVQAEVAGTGVQSIPGCH